MSNPSSNLFAVENEEHFATVMKTQVQPGQLVLLDFTATWCGPCQRMVPHLNALAQEYPNMMIIKVDVDECQAVAQQFNVSSMPTFVFVRDAQIVGNFSGASPPQLIQMSKQLNTPQVLNDF